MSCKWLASRHPYLRMFAIDFIWYHLPASKFMSWLIALLITILAMLLTGCTASQGQPPPSVSPTVTEEQRGAPTITFSPTASATSSPVPVLPSPTPSPIPTVLPTSTPRPAPSPRPSIPISPEEVVQGDPSRPWISLVFNAGAGYRPAPMILDVLKTKGVKTSFFLLGWWAEKEPELVRRIAGDGHEVASHGHRVFDLTQVSDAEVIADLEQAESVIKGITGRTTKPLWSPSAGYRDARVRRLAASLGYRPIFWTLDSGDWREDSIAEGVRQRVLVGAKNGAIIVMHFDSPRTADTVASALPDIIDGLRARGYRLVTISELIAGQ